MKKFEFRRVQSFFQSSRQWCNSDARGSKNRFEVFPQGCDFENQNNWKFNGIFKIKNCGRRIYIFQRLRFLNSTLLLTPNFSRNKNWLRFLRHFDSYWNKRYRLYSNEFICTSKNSPVCPQVYLCKESVRRKDPHWTASVVSYSIHKVLNEENLYKLSLFSCNELRAQIPTPELENVKNTYRRRLRLNISRLIGNKSVQLARSIWGPIEISYIV